MIILDPCDHIPCEDPEICRLDYERHARCVCSEFCSEDFIPVCGSDGRTYTNECYLRRQACRMIPGLRIVFRGQCDQGNVQGNTYKRGFIFSKNKFVKKT